MAGRSAHVRRVSNEVRSPDRRRSSSHGDATPRVPAPALAPAPAPGSIVGAVEAFGALLLHHHDNPPSLAVQAPSRSLTPSPSRHHTTLNGAHPTAEVGPKRLGFFTDMLQLSSAGLLAASAASSHLHSHSQSSPASSLPQRSGTSPIPQSLLPTRTHSRADPAHPLDRERAHSPVPPSSMAAPPIQPNKGHTSPSKASSTRTYDSKLVSREMHRLGNLAHLPSLAPSLSATPSSLSLNMAPVSVPSINATLSAESPWASLHVLVLPLFNGDPLRVSVEDLNQLVKRHISTVVSAAPGKAVATLEHDTFELIAAGMVTLNARLNGVEDERLVPRIVELWVFFWTQVLPYLEGALLPLQTDPILSSLYRLPKSHRPSSPTSTQNGKGSSSNTLLQSTTSQIDVRALALVSFRDRIILHLFPRLYARLTMSKDENSFAPESQQARLQQMLLVLVSQRSQRLASLSLTAPSPQPSAGEAAITRLLRALHAPIATLAPRHPRPTTGAPSFLSAGLPRDRRGRIAQKSELGSPRGSGRGRERWRMRLETEDGEERSSVYWDDGDADTPRVGVAFADPGRERDKELLESLRSPDPDSSARMYTSGWGGPGLGGGNEDLNEAEAGVEAAYDDDEDAYENRLDWDQAQAMVEHMVGIGARGEGGAQQGQDGRRRAVIEGYKV